MTRPSPRKVGKALPPFPTIYVEMRWQDGAWGWSDVRFDNPPSYRTTKSEHDMGYRVVKYAPARRAKGAKS